MHSPSQHKDNSSETATVKSPEQRKPAHTRLTEDQQAPVGLDNPFWKSDEKQSM